ncbi:MAG: recombinase family protein [Clostridiales bacterium]|jgi:DNA invertase Pin-like site-specific DNA recombinase|nr:recombinase family protein [Clostridiales bacterium]
MNESYVVAEYLRISSDDGLHGDSQSISGQRELIRRFIRSHPELKNASVIEFSDDGYSGTNFQRPGVTELLERTRKGGVQCIVVKDFSRFGRNYIEVGDYIEQIFPFLRVRFISINDAYDSETQGGGVGDVSVAFKHLCNDYYCKDLSRKVKSGFRTKWESGKFLASYEVFGYRKSDNDKYKLAVDETTAPVVRRIFDMALGGSKPSQIAAALNADGVPTPLETLSEKRNVRSWSKLRPIWTGIEITRILRDLRYTGAMTNGMYAVDTVGSRQARIKPQSEWYITPDTHEPLVTIDEFERAQSCVRAIKSKGAKYGPRTPSPHSLPVPVRCGGCGHAMAKNNAKVMAYYCKYKNVAACEDCFTDTMAVDALKSVLLSSVQRLQDVLAEQKKAASAKSAEPSIDYVKEVASLQRDIGRMKSEKLSLYNAYSDGELDREAYFKQRHFADEKIRTLSDQADVLERQSQQGRLAAPVIPPAIEYLQDTPGPLQYSNELIAALVEHIVVYSENRVEIVWRYADEIGAILSGKVGTAHGAE